MDRVRLSERTYKVSGLIGPFGIFRVGKKEKPESIPLSGFLAGDERIELPLRVLETPVMPFDQSPVSNVLNIYTMKKGGMSSVIFKINEI